ncbi:MAG TPA: HD domain-containing protein [Anaeromyxobacter sp.]|nr:HD domain-containing protein [Anaeromyxobacter sp.]
MEKIWVKDVKEGERLKSAFLVARKATPTAKSGKTYLSVTFVDKTGELEARSFDRVDELAPLFEEKDYVEVEGAIGAFQGKPQLKIETVSKLDPAAIEASEFVFVPPPEPKKPEKAPAHGEDDAHWKELLALVDTVVDPHVKDLIKAFTDDEDVANRLRRFPAAKTVHHAYPGGLLEHTVSCLKLAHRVADHFPQVDRDLLVAGAFFHDLAKIRELSGERSVEYTDEGRLVGHLVMTAQWVHDKARRVGVSRELEQHIVHIVLAHHGKLEFGSPKVPMTLEAMITHAIDELDSRVNSWLNLMGREGGNRRWTDSNNVYEQPIWRGALPTVQAEKKGPAPELLTPVIYVPREGQPGTGAQKKRPKDREQKQRRPEGRPPGQGQAAQGQAEARPDGAPAEGAAPAESRPERPPRPERHDRGERPDRPPDRGPREHRGFGGSGGPGDKKRGYTGPRLPGDTGPHRPSERKALTHNPFAALAQKLEETGKGEEKQAAPAEASPADAPVAEAAHVAESPPPAAEATSGEAAAAASEPKPE